jgi:hypothetical protein
MVSGDLTVMGQISADPVQGFSHVGQRSHLAQKVGASSSTAARESTLLASMAIFAQIRVLRTLDAILEAV